MKINNNKGMGSGVPQGTLPVQGTRLDAGAAAGASGGARGDRVELSERAKALQVASTEMANLPDIQVDKVSQLKQLVKSGSYWVPGEKIAERMLGEGVLV